MSTTNTITRIGRDELVTLEAFGNPGDLDIAMRIVREQQDLDDRQRRATGSRGAATLYAEIDAEARELSARAADLLAPARAREAEDREHRAIRERNVREMQENATRQRARSLHGDVEAHAKALATSIAALFAAERDSDTVLARRIGETLRTSGLVDITQVAACLYFARNPRGEELAAHSLDALAYGER